MTSLLSFATLPVEVMDLRGSPGVLVQETLALTGHRMLEESPSPKYLLIKKSGPLKMMGDMGISIISQPDFKRLIGPGVYVIWCRGERLYIGSSKNIIHRLTNPTHASVRKALEEADWIELHFCTTESEAREREWRWIAMFKPKLNLTGKSDRQMERIHELIG